MKRGRAPGWPQSRGRVRGRRLLGAAGPGPPRRVLGAAAPRLWAPGRPRGFPGHAGKCRFPLLLPFQARSVPWPRAFISSAVAVRPFLCRFRVIFCAVLSASFNEKTGCEPEKSGLALQPGGPARCSSAAPCCRLLATRRKCRQGAAAWRLFALCCHLLAEMGYCRQHGDRRCSGTRSSAPSSRACAAAPRVSVCSSAAYRTRAVVPTRVGAAVYPDARALPPVRGRARCPRVCTAPPLGVGSRGGAAVPQVPTGCGSTAVRAVRSSAPRSLHRGCTVGAVLFSCGGGGTGG